MAKKMKEEKDRFDGLPEEFKIEVENMTRDEIRNKIAQVSINQVELMKAKKEDGDLIEKRELFKIAGEQYREGTKANRLKIEYCKMLLDNKGG